MGADDFFSCMQEKEAALNLTVDAFCRLVKQHANVAQLVTMYGCCFSLCVLELLFLIMPLLGLI